MVAGLSLVNQTLCGMRVPIVPIEECNYVTDRVIKLLTVITFRALRCIPQRVW